MPKKKPRVPATPTGPEFLLPQPSEEGIRKLRASYLAREGKEITEYQARDVLSLIMRWQYVNILTNTEHAGREEGEKSEGEENDVASPHETITGKPREAQGDAGGQAVTGRTGGTVAAGLPRHPV